MFSRGNKNLSVKFQRSNPLKRGTSHNAAALTNPIVTQYPGYEEDEESAGASGEQMETLREIGMQVSDIVLKIMQTSTVGSSNREEEIHHLFLDKLKYGLPGTDGSRWSNYKEYVKNHHPWISVMLSDPRNPFKKRRRFTLLLMKIGIIFFLGAFVSSSASKGTFIYVNSGGTMFQSTILITICSLLGGTFTEYMARCPCTTSQGSFVDVDGTFERLFLAGASVFFIGMVAGAVILIGQQLSVDHLYFPVILILAILLDFGAFFYLGSINWMVVSWEGILCCPMCPAWYDGDDDGCCGGIIIFPLLSNPIVEFFLNPFFLVESTYLEDRMKFRDEYPGRLCIDDYKDDGGSRVASIQLANIDSALVTSDRSPFVEIYTTTRGSSTYVKCRTNVELSEEMRLMLCDIIKAKTSTAEHTTTIDMVVIGIGRDTAMDSVDLTGGDSGKSGKSAADDERFSLGMFFTMKVKQKESRKEIEEKESADQEQVRPSTSAKEASQTAQSSESEMIALSNQAQMVDQQPSSSVSPTVNKEQPKSVEEDIESRSSPEYREREVSNTG